MFNQSVKFNAPQLFLHKLQFSQLFSMSSLFSTQAAKFSAPAYLNQTLGVCQQVFLVWMPFQLTDQPQQSTEHIAQRLCSQMIDLST